METGRSVGVYQGHEHAVWALACAQTGPYFVTGSLDRTARLWSVERSESVRIFAGHVADVDAVRSRSIHSLKLD